MPGQAGESMLDRGEAPMLVREAVFTLGPAVVCMQGQPVAYMQAREAVYIRGLVGVFMRGLAVACMRVREADFTPDPGEDYMPVLAKNRIVTTGHHAKFF